MTTNADVREKPVEALAIPIREVDTLESITCGFRAEMLRMGEKGEVLSGAGLGNDYLTLKWGDRTAAVRGSEILRAWVETFSPEEAARFPKGVRALPIQQEGDLPGETRLYTGKAQDSKAEEAPPEVQLTAVELQLREAYPDGTGVAYDALSGTLWLISLEAFYRGEKVADAG